MSKLSVAATQMSCRPHSPFTLERAEQQIRGAAARGAQIILIRELIETPYFCIEQDAGHVTPATKRENTAIERLRWLAREPGAVLPCSWLERTDRAFYNSLAILGRISRKQCDHITAPVCEQLSAHPDYPFDKPFSAGD